MFKSYFTLLVLLFSLVTASAQLKPGETPRQLIERLQKAHRDTNRVRLQLRLGGYYIKKPSAVKDDLDSAFTFLNKALALSDSLHAIKLHYEVLAMKGNCFLKGTDLTNGTDCYMQVINYYHNIGDKKIEAATWQKFGNSITYDNGVFVDKKNSCYARAKDIYKQLKDTLGEISVSKDEAELLINQHKFDLAITELEQVLAQYKSIHFKNLHYTYDLLAEANAGKGDYGQELFYRLETVKSMEATGDMAKAATFYYMLDLACSDMGAYDQETTFITKGIAFCRKTHNDDMLVYFVILNTRSLLKQNKKLEALHFLSTNIDANLDHLIPTQLAALDWIYGQVYQKLGKYVLAEKYFKAMMALSDRYELASANASRRADEYMNSCDFYIITKQFSKAQHCVDVLTNLPKNIIHYSAIGEIARLKFKVDSAAGRYLASIDDFELYKKIRDSVDNAKKNKQIAELGIKYQTGLKEKDLQLQQKNIQVLTKQSQLEREQVVQTKTTKNMWIGGSCILFLLTGVTYNRYRLKQRSNLQLQQQKIEISDKNSVLEKLLHDNEWMMRELHHRVKNNMQMVMSLLSSQAAYLNDEVAIKTVTESQHRIQAMSLIHQKLYKTNNVSSVYMPEYIYELVDYLKESFRPGSSVYFDLQIDPIFLDVLQAVPIGLILNEAITNAIKYAFPYAKEDTITIRLTVLDNHEILIAVADNGRGLPDDFNIQQSNTFGMILIQGLTRDLGGRCEIVSNNGTRVDVKFPVMHMPQTALMKN